MKANSFINAAVSAVAFTTAIGWLAPSAIALTLTSSSGTWSNAIGGANLEYNVSPSDALPGENQIRWGSSSAPTTEKSGLGFTGVGLLDFNPGDVFQLGTLRHFNNPVALGTSISAADLDITLNFSNPVATQAFNFTFAIDETPNQTPCSYFSTTPCADRITFPNTLGASTFSIGGIDYTLQLLGFSNEAGGTLVNEFISQERATNSALLFGRITAVEPQESVPEPAAIAGLGLLGIYFLAHRRSKKTQAVKANS